ncbi:MAG: hypothetical protein HYR96_01410, partial [Deltaproteobacteria bacterium]|nr:hypothetical protein [Deltaproteobacteria bacterium]
MLTQKLKVSDVVASLTARDPEELSVFHALLYCAQFLHRRNQADMGLGKRLNDVVGFEIPDESFDPL